MPNRLWWSAYGAFSSLPDALANVPSQSDLPTFVIQRHRHQEFIRFLNTVERQVPADKAVHVVLDNYTTHKRPRVKAWLQRHQRFTFHFTPTSCSWANAVEGLFAKLTRHRLKRGIFKSIFELQAAINRFIAETNDKPKPFVWTKSTDTILAAASAGHKR